MAESGLTVFVALDYDGLIYGIFPNRESARAYSAGAAGRAEGALRVGAWLVCEGGGDLHSIEAQKDGEWKWEAV